MRVRTRESRQHSCHVIARRQARHSEVAVDRRTGGTMPKFLKVRTSPTRCRVAPPAWRLQQPAASPRVLGCCPLRLAGPHARFLCTASSPGALAHVVSGTAPAQTLRPAPLSDSAARLCRPSFTSVLTRACAHCLRPQPNKVVVCLHGRYAGHKAVIVKNFDEGTTTRPYGHALVCGIANYPRKVRTATRHATVTRRVTQLVCERREAGRCAAWVCSDHGPDTRAAVSFHQITRAMTAQKQSKKSKIKVCFAHACPCREA